MSQYITYNAATREAWVDDTAKAIVAVRVPIAVASLAGGGGLMNSLMSLVPSPNEVVFAGTGMAAWHFAVKPTLDTLQKSSA